jgi:transposase
MKYIEGQDRHQQTMFPEVIDDYISPENPVRVIDAFVDNLDLVELDFYNVLNEYGRPKYNPKDMLKLYIYGYFNKIRSSRRLETETLRNVELMWLLNKLSPDHKTISNFRKHNVKALKKVFRMFVKLCLELNLYGRELVAIDGSKFRAVNSPDNNFNQKKLDDRLKRIEEKLSRYLLQLNKNDEEEAYIPNHTQEEIESIIAKLRDRKQVYEDMKNHLSESGQTQLSTTDPDAKRMKQSDGSSNVSFNIQTAVDEENRLVVNYQVTNNANDKNLLYPMAESAKEILGVEELTTLSDTGYFVPTDIVKCLADGITPHISSEYDSITICVPCPADETNIPKKFDNKGKNIYIEERNVGICAMGHILYPTHYSTSRGAGQYRNPKACINCPHRGECKDYYRRVERKMQESDFSTEYDDKDLYIKQIKYSADKDLLRKRKSIVEHPFGTIKRNMDSSYCLLKGKCNVEGEFALTFLAYNMKRAINILGVPRLLEAITG